jgi:hypothetical protein
MRNNQQPSNSNTMHPKRSFKDVVSYDFSITGTTKSGQKLTATIPAGTPRKELAGIFENIGVRF